eukprot:5791916-Pyramimonas_sp.AAC.1
MARRLLDRRRDARVPRRPQTSGMAERTVKSDILGIRAVLHTSGSGHEWWGEAMQAWRRPHLHCQTLSR